MARYGETIAPNQMHALHAAANARGLDHAALHELAADRFRVKSLRDLTRDQAHELLDLLNGKDPEREAEKRARLSGAARRNNGRNGTRPKPNGEPNGKVSRRASDEQLLLIDELAQQAGLTSNGLGEERGRFVLVRANLEAWLRKKFRLRAEARGKAITYTGPRGVLSEANARKAIHGLRKWAEWRRKKWTAGRGRETANAALGIGLPSCYDNAAEEGPLPPELTRAIEEAKPCGNS